MEPPPATSPRDPPWWMLVLASWSIYFLGYVSSDLCLHLTSYDDPANLAVVLSAASRQLVNALGLGTFLYLFFSGLFLLSSTRLKGTARTRCILFPSLLAWAVYFLPMLASQPTSREQFKDAVRFDLPPDLSHYLAIHRNGRTNGMTGFQDVYSFTASEAAIRDLEARINHQFHASEITPELKADLLRNLPPEFSYVRSMPNAYVLGGRSLTLINQRGSPKVLLVVNVSPR